MLVLRQIVWAAHGKAFANYTNALVTRQAQAQAQAQDYATQLRAAKLKSDARLIPLVTCRMTPRSTRQAPSSAPRCAWKRRSELKPSSRGKPSGAS
jgi:hypothetical protein